MEKSAQEHFDEILAEAFKETEAFRCSKEEHIEGLQTWVNLIQVMIQALKGEHHHGST